MFHENTNLHTSVHSLISIVTAHKEKNGDSFGSMHMHVVCFNCTIFGLKFHLFLTLTTTANLNLRLSNGSNPFEGRVEQYYAGTWGTVCDDGWDLNNAKVVCRQLGLGEAVKAVRGAYFGQGRGYTMLSNVDCIGHESALGWCLHSGWRGRTCSHSKDACVVCKGKQYYDILFLDYPN